MKGKWQIVLLGVVFFLLVFLSFPYFLSKNVIGVSANELEEYDREASAISSEWEVSKSVGENVAVLLYYDESQCAEPIQLYKYNIYIKEDGLNSGFSFIAGGTDTVIPEDPPVYRYRLGSKGSVLFSMNKDKVSRIELDKGIDITKFEIDPNKPFTLAIPPNSGAVKLYNTENELVEVSASDLLR